jgi:hypothetical protein
LKAFTMLPYPCHTEMCNRFPCITRSMISATTNFIQSRLDLDIINLTVKILTNSNNLFGNLLHWTIYLLCKCIFSPHQNAFAHQKDAFAQQKVGATDCVRRWNWCALLCVTDTFVSTFSRDVLKTLHEFPVVLSSVWSGESWSELERLGEKWWKGLIISDNQAETCLIVTNNDTSIGDLPLIIYISDTCKNQPKRLDSDNTINLSRLIVSLALCIS